MRFDVGFEFFGTVFEVASIRLVLAFSSFEIVAGVLAVFERCFAFLGVEMTFVAFPRGFDQLMCCPCLFELVASGFELLLRRCNLVFGGMEVGFRVLDAFFDRREFPVALLGGVEFGLGRFDVAFERRDLRREIRDGLAPLRERLDLAGEFPDVLADGCPLGLDGVGSLLERAREGFLVGVDVEQRVEGRCTPACGLGEVGEKARLGNSDARRPEVRKLVAVGETEPGTQPLHERTLGVDVLFDPLVVDLPGDRVTRPASVARHAVGLLPVVGRLLEDDFDVPR